jgi:hypothetical protein
MKFDGDAFRRDGDFLYERKEKKVYCKVKQNIKRKLQQNQTCCILKLNSPL